jgi:outer membrane protein assembly factor BamA
LEFTSGFRSITFDREADTQAFSLRTGDLLVDRTDEKLPSPDSINLGQSSAALVYDSSLFGPASPIMGRRYRLEGGATYGSLAYSDVLADFRQYFMPVRPYTIAMRVMHSGRYGRDSETNRIIPLFVGYPNLVRGYDAYTFDASECDPQTGTCPVFERLFGSKMLVANLELRFPLFGAFSEDRMYGAGPLPVELALFADGGIAWTNAQDPFTDRDPVTSAGVAVRVAIQRYMVLELDFVRPFDRPEKGWMFQFNMRPGF